MPSELDMQVAAWEEYYSCPPSPPLQDSEVPPQLTTLRQVVFLKQLTRRQYFEIIHQLNRLQANLTRVEPPELKQGRALMGEKNLAAAAAHRADQERKKLEEAASKKGDGSFKPLFKW